MTEKEKQAALDALSGLLGDDQPGGGSGANTPQIAQEYADAWNKIMEQFDNDTTTPESLTDLLTDIRSGKVKTL